jgi:hypothetical protein
MTFRYEAFTADGKPRTGNIEANTPEDATSKIRHELGLFVMKIEAFVDGKPIRTVLNHSEEPVQGTMIDGRPSANVTVPSPDEVLKSLTDDKGIKPLPQESFGDFLEERSKDQAPAPKMPWQQDFGVEELRAISDKAMYNRENCPDMWSQAYLDLAKAAEFLSLMIERKERYE